MQDNPTLNSFSIPVALPAIYELKHNVTTAQAALINDFCTPFLTKNDHIYVRYGNWL